MGDDPSMSGVRGLASQAFNASQVFRLSRRLLAARGRFVLMFHGVATTRVDSLPREIQPDLTVAELRAVLSWLRDRFAFLTPDEVLDSSRPGVLLTFDDGFANFAVNVLPILSELGAPAVVFVTTQHVRDSRDWLSFVRTKTEKAWTDPAQVPERMAADVYDGLSVAQIRECASSPLITVGSHTVTHPFLTSCSDSELASELGDSRRYLEEVTGKGVDLFAYPKGVYDRRVAEAVRTEGYRAAFAIDSEGVGLPRYEIPRIGIYSAHPAYLSSKLSGLYRRPLAPVPVRERSA